jgi:hypothetical protein
MYFEDWFHAAENSSLRSERFYDDLISYHSDVIGDRRILDWLRMAYHVGREHAELKYMDDGK